MKLSKYQMAWWLGGSAMLVSFVFSLKFGSVSLSLDEVLAGLRAFNDEEMSMTSRILIDLRLPRALLAIIAGAGLAMVGALLQTTTRNDLADPFLFGLSSGASAGAVLVITQLGDALGVWSLPLAAFAGGIVSASAVLILFSMQKKRGNNNLVLCGLAISFLFGAVTSFLIYSGDQRAASSILFWTMGGLGLARWENLIFAAIGVLCVVVLILFRYRELDTLLVSEQTTHSLGVNVHRLRSEVFLCCAFCTASIVALTGVVGFIGLMVPHLVRPFSGMTHKLALPLVALWGAVMLTLGDIVSRTILSPQELPVGIVTAALGGVFVLYLVWKKPAS
ncbi:putative ABC-type Fe3+-siderophore transport system, permease component [Vibrio nigripulchritudo SFn27]|uniref:Putative ABC-type Fe3+-siderophore transport system, permease component n=2 Tax=Vibrio nigripulchritudo TaxID=28173 RepID=U4KG09_9VIBR|nr:putative ABC-type Fe3+-siderophore transport system, permease component [Vibrio nigripulchritudo BLFn1]CCN89838.1 putative ABC-type Fe3+-siderophore transport system, permease component [Vibrio nigripulchritudo SFn27]CCN92235.1 putative ABC-type Fe3+-siderophore transport system, permease component [Vibrio nigripulchritudo ENn2]CCO43722.1 putative ABC-type Fe3+-siderophore transport system, permease component [Vibrio nigripulchritudo SFn135]CCO53036.1 putative ABC-type Fe3+-siderophore trans